MVFHRRKRGRPCVPLWSGRIPWAGLYVHFFSGFYYSEVVILTLLFIVHGISVAKSYSISSWLANRKMSELQDQIAELLTQENVIDSIKPKPNSNSTSIPELMGPLKPRCS